MWNSASAMVASRCGSPLPSTSSRSVTTKILLGRINVAKWTEVELDALQRTADSPGMDGYHAFGALTGYSKPFDAWEVKRRRINNGGAHLATQGALALAGPAVMPDAELVAVAELATYAGFNIGFWDLETTFSTQPIVLYGAVADVFGRVEGWRKGRDITDDKALVKAAAMALTDFDIWATWNGKLFDVPVLNGRLRYHGLPPLPLTKHMDLMYYATGGSMRIGRRSLQSVSEYFDVPNRKTPLNVRTWDKAMAGDAAAYDKIVEHCDADVLVTRDVFRVLKTQIASIHR
jgi:uncharacterized protein YprB with RNaseH-like and TPR domain